MSYQKYKTEIWGVIGLLAIILPAIVVPILAISKECVYPCYAIYIGCLVGCLIVCSLIIIIVFSIRKKKAIKLVEANKLVEIEALETERQKAVGLRLSEFNGCVIEEAKSEYWYYGMSGEIKNNDSLLQYMSKENHSSRIRIILLHPDCKSFRDRISGINPANKIEDVIKEKRDNIKHLLETVAQQDKNSQVEIRFTQSYPIWILQFIDTEDSIMDDVDKMYLKIHPPHEHSKNAPSYEADKTANNIVYSFKTFFWKEWEDATRMSHSDCVSVNGGWVKHRAFFLPSASAYSIPSREFSF